MVLKFEGVESISEAEALIGSELQVPEDERAALEAGSAYVSDLIGAAVWDGDREVGVVKDVRFGAGEAPLLVVGGRGTRTEHEIPFAEAYLQMVDVAQKIIRMVLPEGMLEVNAPLTEEEKRAQQESSRRG
jgi:16S rRNA processing protein RimM